TNLLFFTKGEPTKEVWYYEHPYPEGAKSYNKTRPMRIEEFAPEKAWWGGEKRAGRQESEQAWKVSVEQIKANGYNLDIKNPNTVADVLGDPEELLVEYKSLLADVAKVREQLKIELMDALGGEHE
ncbi:MAG: N-6 DNA methylase, partial [Desulfuromonadales bacterium]